MNSVLKYTLELFRCLVKSETPSPIPEGITVKELLEFGLAHKTENIIYAMLKKAGVPEAELSEFGAYHMLGAYREASQQVALDAIEAGFSKRGIYHLALKGSFLKNLYPGDNLRQLNDLDILIESDKYLEAKEIMLSLGFETNEEIFGECYDDTYTKGNIVMVEVHRHLSRKANKWEYITLEIEKNLKKDENMRFVMSNEDFYIYNLIHMAKHMYENGFGVRNVLDTWIFNREYFDSLDFEYISDMLKKADLVKFNEAILNLIDYWFEGKKADKLTEDFGKFISESGWVGSESQRASEELYQLNGEKDGKTGKLKYYLKITFIPLEAMQFRYPVLKKAPFLLPVFWFVRIVRAVFKRQEVIKDVSGHFKDADIQRGNEISALKRKIGL